MSDRAALCVGVSLCLGLAAGCGASDREPVFPARGQVFFGGKPVPHAQVTLHPLVRQPQAGSDNESPRPHGTAGTDGRFTLTTYQSGDGAPAGEYGVTVECWLTTARAGMGEGNSPPPTNRLPARYSRITTSGLRVRIEPGDNQIPTIKLSR
jgi:hypothetical protein